MKFHNKKNTQVALFGPKTIAKKSANYRARSSHLNQGTIYERLGVFRVLISGLTAGMQIKRDRLAEQAFGGSLSVQKALAWVLLELVST